MERSKFSSSVLVPRAKKVTSNSRQQRRVDQSRHRAITRQVYHESVRTERGVDPVDWRQVLQLMIKATPEESLEWVEDGIEIEFTEHMFKQRVEDVSDTALSAIRKRHGVVIKVSPKAPVIVLSGTRPAINRATEEFKNVARKITVTKLYLPIDMATGEDIVEKFDMSDDFVIPPLSIEEGAPRRKQALNQHVFNLSIPHEWTPETLRAYVLSLVDSYTEAHLHSTLYPANNGGVAHQRAVIIRVLRLIRKLSPKVGVSRSVLKLALSYMTRKGDIYLEHVRYLFVMMERRGVPMDVDVFNILLEAPVKLRDLRKFKQTIYMMTKRGLTPNLDTWILFLRMFESVEIRQYILQAMNAKHMLGAPRAIQRVGEEMAPFDAEHAAIHGTSLNDFLSEQRNRYGPHWLTRIAGNKVLHVLGQYSRLQDSFRLLDIMWSTYSRIPRSDSFEQKLTRPASDSYRTILNHAWVIGSTPAAVTVVRKMQTKTYPTQPTSEILDILFRLAWSKNMRTTIVVLWRYAALARITTYGMRRRVASLLRGETNDGGPHHDDKMLRKRYDSLGGEMLARELAGGREVLKQLRTLCRRTWGEDYPWSKLGSLSAKVLPTAFKDHAPAVTLSRVLCQSVRVDFACLRARKTNHLRELLPSAQVKSLPLWPRTEQTARYVDVGPREDIEPGLIKIKDQWGDEWDSQGWEVPKPARGPNKVVSAQTEIVETRSVPRPGTYGISAASKAEVDESDQFTKSWHTEPTEPTGEIRMAIIDPRIWDDNALDVPAADNRTPLQKQNEQACLEALEELSKAGFNFPNDVISPEDEVTSEEDEQARINEGFEYRARQRKQKKSESLDKDRRIDPSEFSSMMRGIAVTAADGAKASVAIAEDRFESEQSVENVAATVEHGAEAATAIRVAQSPEPRSMGNVKDGVQDSTEQKPTIEKPKEDGSSVAFERTGSGG